MSPLRDACVRIVAPGGGQGTGYLVAPDRLATAEHVVRFLEIGESTDVGFADASLTATLLARDQLADCAILGLGTPVTGITPLTLGGPCTGKAEWESFGFVAAARTFGMPLTGSVLAPDHPDDLGRPASILFSPQIAAGSGADAHGFSGSPVVVDGRVIGHLKRIIADLDSPAHAAFGILYSTHAASVAALLGVPPPVPVASPPIREIRELLPVLKGGEYHVLVSYRAADRTFALQLASRLEDTGFRVLPDQHETLDDEGAAAFARCLSIARSAVMVVSGDAARNGSYDRAAETLAARTLADRAFTFVPVRLDDADLPNAWNGLSPLRFSRAGGPAGPEMVRLLWRLLGQPGEQSAEYRINQSTQTATEQVLASIRQAAKDQPQRVYRIWQGWRQAGPPDAAVAALAAEKLIGAGQPDRALEVLGSAPQGLRAEQLKALALKRLGRHTESLPILEALFTSGARDAETCGLLAAAYKRKWERTQQRGALFRSFDLYSDTFTRTRDSWNGINAAALALALGHVEDARARARELIRRLDAQTGLNHHELATLGEAWLLLGDLEAAREWYQKAVALEPALFQDIAVMRKQARRNLRQLRLPEDALDSSLPVPAAVAFISEGNLFQRVSPSAAESRVLRSAIRRELGDLQAAFGFSSLASDSDVVFIDEIVRREGQAYVYLPAPRAALMEISTDRFWGERVDELLSQPHVSTHEVFSVPPGRGEERAAYGACHDRALEESVRYAEEMGQTATLLALPDRTSSAEIDGASRVERWTTEGGAARTLDVTTGR